MPYQALYRKYRSQTFGDVVGQDAITKTLRKQVAAGNTTHAYLFTGTRGTGKTSCAKILARAVNCENQQDGEPCNVCTSCQAILSGQATDVHEFDAASHSGVDNIRALRDETVYSPAAMKKRVYIIDEVHMLSIGAFNALLTILEEPPSHVLFILATTETHKVPATILSRCQKFHFKRLANNVIAARLQYVAQADGLTLPDDSANLLAQWADGSMRDGLSLLERCVSLPECTPETIEQALGLAGQHDCTQLATYIAQGDAADALTLFGQLYQDGKEAATLLDELRGLLHNLLMVQVLRDESKALSTEQQALIPQFSPPRLTQALTLLQKTLAALPRSVNVRLDAELCLLKLTDESLAATPAAGDARPGVLPTVQSVPTPKTPTSQEFTQRDTQSPTPPQSSTDTPSTPLQQYNNFQALIAALQGVMKPSELAHLRLCKAAISDDSLTIMPDSPLAKALLNNSIVLDKIRNAANSVEGRAITVRIGDKPKPTPVMSNDPLDALAGLENVTIV
ncbi:MAG: DNA polymerase III subunit gamma/tau [Oscillospiraceae bacterium]|nr:DNA polymerase III subunit gamma/tau [Oscillospiraceae bacterium]